MKSAAFLLVLIAALAATGATAGAPAAAKTPATSHTPEPAQREITYADLETQIGKRIVVHTTLGTVRSGVLIKYTKTEFEMKLDEGTELTVPASTIRSLSMPAQLPDPSLPPTGDGSAKKN